MITQSGDYFRYLPTTPEMEPWGIWVSGAGIAETPPNHPYPPVLHPRDHHFEWKQGRILEALQIVLITEGEGWFESHITGKKKIRAGAVFLLLPGVWHRYRPAQQTGWKEKWIEIQGRTIDALIAAGIISSTAVLRERDLIPGIEESINAIHRRILGKSPLHKSELSAEALRLLSLLSKDERSDTPRATLRQIIREAERLLTENHEHSINIEEMALDLGISYSSFRRAFRQEIGLSPWQYLLRIRLSRVRRLLASDAMKLDEAAAIVGFSSAFHLSAAFKKCYGISPDQWRKNMKLNYAGASTERAF